MQKFLIKLSVIWFGLAVVTSGCAKDRPIAPIQNVSSNVSVNSPLASNITTNSTDQAAAGADFVNRALASVPPTWVPPLPPPSGQKPRALTQAEKEKVLEIANAFPPVADLKNNPDVVGVFTNYLWVEWIGHADGEGFLNYIPVEKGTVNVSNKSDTWFPAADFLFQSRFSKLSAAGIHVAVNLETGKVVWSGGYVGELPDAVSNTSNAALPTENVFITMKNVGTMSGTVTQLAVSENGSVMFIKETGMRFKLPGNYITRSVKTGVLTNEDRDRLRGMVAILTFNSSGTLSAGTHFIDAAVFSTLSLNPGGTAKTITTNFDPLLVDAQTFTDIPEPVRALYHELWGIAANRTTLVSSEKIY